MISRRAAVKIGIGIPLLAASSPLVNSALSADSGPLVTGGDVPEDVVALLDPGDAEFPITAHLSRTIEFGSATYFIIEQTQTDTGVGEPVVIKKPAAGLPVILEDFIGLPQAPLPVSFNDTTMVDISLFALPDSETVPDRAPLPPAVAATDLQDRKVADTAHANVGLDSSRARGTSNGRLACAWAVNQIVDRALLRPILDGPRGLSTSNLAKVLRSKHVRVPDPKPGVIVISPTVYSPRANIGHVGIVGDNGLIYSNSSSAAKWSQNFTIAKWNNYYRDRKHLSVEYYRLDDIYFPQ